MNKPNFVFEVSWEVCNMVGGIHTVLQSKAQHMKEHFGDEYICVGPYVPQPISTHHAIFREEIWDDGVYKLLQDFSSHGVSCQMGRWLVPGEPRALLVGFRDLFHQKDRILAHYWEKYHVDSLFGGYDYVEPVLFAHAAGLLIEQIYNRILFPDGKTAVAHCHEWMTSIALLHLKETAPEIGTVFTTHATMLGRALSSRDGQKSLASFIREKSPSQWAHEIGVDSKHSVEVTTAREVDCFTTVSQTTSDESEIILGKKADIVVLNGLSDSVPSPDLLQPSHKNQMRTRLLQIAQEVTGYSYDPGHTFVVITSGRYEYRNKGVDLLIDAVMDLKKDFHTGGATGGQVNTSRKIITFVMCPAGHGGRVYPRSPEAFSTHQLTDPAHDPLSQALIQHKHTNSSDSPVHVVFVPIYLNGTDPSIHETYWELAAGADLAAFPSWYEPWGYTPHEAISLGIPTITTDCAGFGRWVQEQRATPDEAGVFVLPRTTLGYQGSREELRQTMRKYIIQTMESPDISRRFSTSALRTASRARWSDLIDGYLKAYSLGLDKAAQRISNSPRARFRSFSLGNYVAPSPFSHARASVRNFAVTTEYSKMGPSLREFTSRMIGWRWNPKMLQLFYKLDAKLWDLVDQKPSLFLQNLNQETLKEIESKPDVHKLYEEIKRDNEELNKILDNPKNFDRAYFCMEYGITDKLRIYSGGLGILAGDHLKTAADMKLPLAAFGLFYQYGYFSQALSTDGHQIAHYHRSDIEKLKLNLVQDDAGGRLLLSIPYFREDEDLYFQVWKLELGSVELFLLDSNVIENSPHLRNVTDRLYGTEPGKRISQEWLLSLGGLELIKKLKLPVQVFHMNEGHTAFLVIGRILDLMREKGLSFDEALDYVRFTTIFTTHTPVAAGHDEFSLSETTALLRRKIRDPQILDRAIALGASLKGPGSENQFSMTALAMRGSRWVNAVSAIHKTVSQRMFNNLYPDLDPKEVPVTHVTNGVHVPYWLEPNWQNLFYEVLGAEWPKHTTDAAFWRQLEKVPSEKIWEIKLGLKSRLIRWIRKRMTQELVSGQHRPEAAERLACLDENTLIITHAKRMAPYKRADILFHDPDRLYQVIKHSPVPILFIYAGKAHPSDTLGQEALQRLYRWSQDHRFKASVLVLENYDLSFARRLLSGSDIWLNTPIRPLEASGTSGMKAAINGTLHFSVADGWWPEAYNGKNGWMIGDGSENWDRHLQDAYDRERIFHLLENEILPQFARRRGDPFSEIWVRKIRESIMSIMPFVSSERMLKEYDHNLYQPSLNSARELSRNNYEQLKKFRHSKDKLLRHWNELEFESVELVGIDGESVSHGQPLEVELELSHPGLQPEDLQVQAVLGRKLGVVTDEERLILPLECLGSSELRSSRSSSGHQLSRWRLRLDNPQPGDYMLALRACAQRYPGFDDSGFQLRLVKWL